MVHLQLPRLPEKLNFVIFILYGRRFLILIGFCTLGSLHDILLLIGVASNFAVYHVPLNFIKNKDVLNVAF